MEMINNENFYDVPIMMTNDNGYNKAYRLATEIHDSDRELFNKAEGSFNLSSNSYYLGVMNHYINNVFDFPRLELDLYNGKGGDKLAKIANMQ